MEKTFQTLIWFGAATTLPAKVLRIADISDYGGLGAAKRRQQGKDEEAGQLSGSSKVRYAPYPFLILLEANS